MGALVGCVVSACWKGLTMTYKGIVWRLMETHGDSLLERGFEVRESI